MSDDLVYVFGPLQVLGKNELMERMSGVKPTEGCYKKSVTLLVRFGDAELTFPMGGNEAATFLEAGGLKLELRPFKMP